MSDGGNERKGARLDDFLKEMRENLELREQVDDIRSAVVTLTGQFEKLGDQFARHIQADADDKAETLREIRAIPGQVERMLLRALRGRPDDTPAPGAPPRSRVSRELAAHAAVETTSADLVTFAPPAPAAPLTAPQDPGVLDDLTGIGTRARRLWGRVPRRAQTVIQMALVAGVTSLAWGLGCRGWVERLNEIRIDVPPPRDLGLAHDLVVEKKPPPPPPEPKPKSPPGRPRPDTKRDRAAPHYFPYATVECDGSPREPEHCNSDRKLR